MSESLRDPLRRLRPLWVALPLLAGLCGCSGGSSPDPLASASLIQPAELAARLADSTAARPLLIHVGFEPLYRAGAIPGTRFVGPGSKPEGIAGLEQVAKDLPRDRDVVLYCGCCPWVDCPNVRPAFRAMRDMGFTNVHPLYIAKNLETDWTMRGYPMEKPGP